MSGYDVHSIYLDMEFNVFEDESGYLVNIHNYLTPNELYLLRYQGGGTIYKKGPSDIMYEIVVPID